MRIAHYKRMLAIVLITVMQWVSRASPENIRVMVDQRVFLGNCNNDGGQPDVPVTTTEMENGRQSEADMNDVHFLLWTKNNPGDSDYYELKLNDTSNLAASPFNVSLPTYALVHGWLGSGRSPIEWPVQTKTVLLLFYACNVITIDWADIAKNTDYLSVIKVLPQVGQHSAQFLDYLHNEGGFNITSLYLIGHSLGAHLSGFVGASVVSGPIGRITGLDPAGPAYENATDDQRLNKADAAFVDIIHTNGCPLHEGCAGIEVPIGHVDYYPNGGEHQPNCTDSLTLRVFCSHSRVIMYWVESISSGTPFTSVPCSDWNNYLAGGCPRCGQGCLDMGFHTSTTLRGTYFLKTNVSPPFAQG